MASNNTCSLSDGSGTQKSKMCLQDVFFLEFLGENPLPCSHFWKLPAFLGSWPHRTPGSASILPSPPPTPTRLPPFSSWDSVTEPLRRHQAHVGGLGHLSISRFPATPAAPHGPRREPATGSRDADGDILGGHYRAQHGRVEQGKVEAWGDGFRVNVLPGGPSESAQSVTARRGLRLGGAPVGEGVSESSAGSGAGPPFA